MKPKKIEEQLKLSEERFRKVFMTSPDSIALSRLSDGRFVEINEGFKNITGYTEAEVIGKTSSELSLWERQEDRQRFTDKLQKENFVSNFEAHFRAKNGSPIIALLSASIITINGELHLVSVARDITARKHTEEALQKREKQLKIITDSARDAIVMIDSNGKISFWNTAAEKMFGFDKDEAIGQNLHLLIAPKKYHTMYKQGFKNFRHNGKGKVVGRIVEMTAVHKNGREFSVEISLSAIKNKNLWGAVAIIRDITERKEAKKQLCESEHNFRLLFEESPLGTYIAKTDGSILRVNRAALDILGSPSEEATRKINVLQFPPLQQNGYADLFRKCVNTGEIQFMEISYRSKWGKDSYLSNYLVPLKTPDGKVYRVYTLMRNISDRKKAENEKEKLQQQLIQAQKMESVGRLAGGIAHDFNNMLTIIQGNVELAAMQIPKDDPLNTYLREIKQTADRSAALTRQLLAFARKQTAEPRIIDLNASIKEMLKMLRRLIGEYIDLQWHPSVHPQTVLIDPVQVDQILANLCVNARDAIGNENTGKIIIETDITVLDQAYCDIHPGFHPGTFATLTVSDDGSGMDKKILSHIFEPFYTTKALHSGTGLGLATIYGIVKQNNGFINVYSEPDMGTTFKIYLPLQSMTEVSANTKPLSQKLLTGNETVLVIDNEASILTMTTQMLEAMNYTVLTADTPSKALETAKLQKDRIDMLLTDLIMPVMNGKELSKKIRKIFPDIKILFMSGYPADVIANEGIINRNISFIHKPFGIHELSAKIREVLDRD